MMNILIIEDESLAADKLEMMLKEVDPSVTVLAKLGSIKESVKWLFQNSADLIFLDIQLSDGISFSIDFDMLLANIRGKEPAFKKRFLIQTGEKIRKIEVTEIAYFYVLEKSVFLRTFQGNSYAVDYTLDKLESMLNPSAFFRINRKYFLNMDSITNMVAYSRGRVKLDLKPKPDDDSDMVVSIDRTADFKKWLNS